jgi:hypothetical protein
VELKAGLNAPTRKNQRLDEEEDEGYTPPAPLLLPLHLCVKNFLSWQASTRFRRPWMWK